MLYWAGMLPAQVTPESTNLMDWLYMYVKGHLVDALFDTRVAQSFSRMTVGDRARFARFYAIRR